MENPTLPLSLPEREGGFKIASSRVSSWLPRSPVTMSAERSSAGLRGATTKTPEFTPDVAGKYDVKVTDEASGSQVTIPIYIHYSHTV